jgi:mono/diheme cytochrome c family protein
MKIRIFAIALIGILIYSCSPKTTPLPTEIKKDTSASLAEGKSLYENNCAKCHKLYNPNDYNAQEWLPILESMQKKAKISDAEHDKIYAYLTAN